MEITRVFHPVGQGAFYSEHHICDDGLKYNVVYDCGSTSNNSSKLLNDAVRGTFKKDDEIDILFISHFHEDHVCGLSVLTDYKIKNIVLPEIDPITKIYMFVANMENVINIDSKGLLLYLLFKPEEVVGNDTKIFYVKQGDDTHEDDAPIPLDTLIANYGSSHAIENGTKISLTKDNIYWMYKVYNHITDLAKNANLNQDLTKIIGDLSDSDVVIKYLLTLKNRKSVKDCFEKNGYKNLNLSSMLVSSSPYRNKKDNNLFRMISHNGLLKKLTEGDFIEDRVGCIYTGDYLSDKADKLSDIFKVEWEDIGTIQIPHHGSKYNFAIDKILSDKNHYSCPLSYGNDNVYHHPADGVIAKIASFGSKSISVTENKETLFVEVIKMDDNSNLKKISN